MKKPAPAARNSSAATLVDLLRSAARERPEELAFAFLREDGAPPARLTLAGLDTEARRIAGRLAGLRGERALLLYPPGLEFLTAFFGCLYAGVVAVPGYPPRNPRHLPRLETMVRASEAQVLLTVEAARGRLEAWQERATALGRRVVLVTDEAATELDAAAEFAAPVPPTPHDLALLQFTSGSTSDPRGVMVTHHNLLSNCAALRQALDTGPKSLFVNWLPHFHDMGLVGTLLLPLFSRCPGYLLDPSAFLQRPLRWLEAISGLGATHGLAPNFAYDLLASRAAAVVPGSLDLGRWRCAANAAEPLRADTLERFASAFAPHGFSPRAFLAGYGLAEGTLLATAAPAGTATLIRDVDAAELERGRFEPARAGRSQRLVSSGRAALGVHVRVVDPESGQVLPPGQVGEVWLAGPSVARGYWRQPEATEATFGGRLADGGGPYLRTGDLGCLDADGELFVTGRCKDLIIVDGANHYPQDLELTVERSHPAFRAAATAAFAEEAGGRETLTVVQELERTERHGIDVEDAFARVQAAVAAEHELRIERLVLVPPGTVPKTSSGKIQRRACRAALAAGSLPVAAEARARGAGLAAPPPAADPLDLDALRVWLRTRVAALVGVTPERIEETTPLAAYGLVSREAVALSGELSDRLGRPLAPTLIYDQPTIAALLNHLGGAERPVAHRLAARPGPERKPIAVLGLGCRFPGAPDPEAFWQLLAAGREALGEVPAERWNATACADSDPDAAGRIASRSGGFLPGVDQFDAGFFQLSRREAERLDPQQRLLLEVAWEALEDAGIAPHDLAGSATGVFIGCSHSDYGQLQLAAGADTLDAHVGTGSALSAAAGRLSYTLGLEGPSLVVDTACSSSLVALHLACESLARGESTLALVGGVNLLLAPELSITFSRARMLSPRGRCRAFDIGADGYVRSEGCGVVVLQALDDARVAERRVRAVVRGSAVNQDGRSNGLTAPSGAAQERVMKAALATAGVTPEAIAYVEGHGTGTPLGDPIELRALERVFGAARKRPLLVGSVKTNLGHLEAAAGLAGVIKTVLALERGIVPASLHFERFPAAVDGLRALAVPTVQQPWPSDPDDRLAGVSSFGFVGTNAHVILAGAPEPERAPSTVAERGAHLLVASARSSAALGTLAGRLAERLATIGDDRLGDLCHAAGAGRWHGPERLALVAGDAAEAERTLSRFAEDGRAPGLRRATSHPDRSARPVFVFAGQGAVHPGMGAALVAGEPVFGQVLAECDEVLRPILGVSLFDVLDDSAGHGWLGRTEYAQPVLFAFELALAELWRSWGIEPAAVIGHSLGEYAAAAVAGVFPRDAGLRLVAGRARLMAAAPAGGMLAVAASEERVAALLTGGDPALALAAVNAPDRVVLTGPPAALAAIARTLGAAQIESRPLAVGHAFHSSALDDLLEPLGALIATMPLAPPRCPLISNVDGRAVGAEVTRPEHWRRQARQPVRFAAGVAELERLGHRLFLEIGPDGTLCALGRRASAARDALWLPTLRPGAETRQLLDSLGELYVRGARVDWAGLDRGRARRPVALPTYPFERERYWMPSAPAEAAVRAIRTDPADHPLLGSPVDLAGAGSPRIWRSTLDLERLPWLADHRIEGTVVFPAAGYAEMAARAADTVPLVLGAVRFEAPLTLGPGDVREVQTRLLEAAGHDRLEIFSRPSGTDAPWTCHSRAELRPLEAAGSGSELDLGAILARCQDERDGAGFYRAWSKRGNQWGPAFQGIERLWLGRDEGLGRLRMPPVPGAGEPFLLRPGWLDACGQVLAAVTEAASTGAFVGHGADALRLYAAPRGTTFWSHARVRPSAEQPGALVGDLRIADENGRVFAEMAGVRLDFLVAGARPAIDPARWLHAVSWRRSEPRRTAPPAACVVRGDTGTRAHGLARALAAAGAVLDGPLEGASRLLHLGGLDLVAPGNQSGAGIIRLAELLRELALLLAQLASLPPDPTTGRTQRLWLVTPGAWHLDGDSRLANPLAAGLWGFARGLAAEHPEQWGGIVDLAAEADGAHIAEDLLGALADAERDGEDALALRSGVQWVPRLEPLPAPPPAPPPRCRADGTYLITGGLGSLGLHFAVWLAEMGARRLALVSRRGLPPRRDWRELDPESAPGRAVTAILALEARGVNVHVAAVDVADADALAAWLADFRAEGWPAIRGVIHAAGVVEPRLIAELPAVAADEIAAELGAKAGGALILDRLLATDPLDFFVLFSSAAALLSSPRLAVYAAGNAVLDALAAERRAQGRPALALAWGAWAGGGMAAALADEPRIDRRLGLEVAARCWSSPAAQVAVLPHNWTDWGQRHPAAAAAPLLRSLRRTAPALAQGGEPPVEDGGAPPVDAAWLAHSLDDWLRVQAAQVLRQEPASLDPDQPLQALGFDSLLALELRHRLERRLAVAVPAVELLRGPSLAQLAARLRATPRPVAGAAIAAAPKPRQAFPLAHAQRAQWLLWRLDPESPAYHVTFTARTRSALDLGALARAAAALVRRHPALGITVETRAGEPWQRLAPAGLEPAVEVELLDAAGLDDEGLRRLATAAYRRPFDLATGPLLRLHVLERGDERLLLLVAHHIACDGWSLWIAVDELGALLAAETGRPGPPLAPLSATYEDHVRAEAALLTSPAGERLEAYWRQRLAGAPPELELPGQRPRPTQPSRHGASHRFTVAPELTRELQALARRHGATLFTTLLAAYAALLHRVTGVPALRLGTPTAGRGDARLAGVVGDFVNPVVLCLDVGGRPSFEQLLPRVHDTVLDALAHAELPFQVLVERLVRTRTPGRHPLYQLDFVLQQSQQGTGTLELMAPGSEALEVPWGGLVLEPFPLPQQEGQLDLSLEMAQSRGALTGLFKYDPALFDPADVARLAELYARLLVAVVTEPGRALAGLPWLGAAERRQLVAEGCGNPGEAATGALHERVGEQARRTPDAVALEDAGGALTYGALWRDAGRLAANLRDQGVGPDTVVALLVERSPTLVAAMLAVLVAGGAYLPLDLDAPAERLDGLLVAAGAALVLVDAANADRLPAGAPPAVEIGAGRAVPDDAPVAPAPRGPVAVHPETLAYALFTSGSTGRPKAVAVPHRAIVNHMVWLQRALPLTPCDRVLQRTAASFDAAVWEIWAPLLVGATLVLAPPRLRLDPAGLVTTLVAHRATVLQAVPSLLDLLVDQPGLARAAALRRLCAGGEPLVPELRDRLLALLPDLELVNLYGPTEVTIDATWHHCRPSDGASVPIGRPIDGLAARVLDRDLALLPAGALGELGLVGAGLARGYLGRPAATAERFVPDAELIAGRGGGRLYRTGDRARWLPNGTLECHGRIDRQVKLRGHRVELGEVEARLRACAGVREAAVDVRTDEAGGARLVAYLVPADPAAGAGADLAARLARELRRTLPPVMVPAQFVTLPALPRTAGGKIDRPRLPAPGRERPLLDADYRAPRGELEGLIADAWGATLGLDRPGAEDNFFELGGHSLLLAQVHARLEAPLAVRFGRELPLIELFQHPTIRSLAEHLAGGEGPEPAVPASRRGARRGERLVERGERGARRRLVLREECALEEVRE